jgi:1-phosphofructokinase
LNSAIDQTITVPEFSVNAVNRVSTTRSDAGGKGINVASFLAQAGHKVAVAGFLGRENDALFVRHFDRLDLSDHCTRLDGATRTNIKIVDPTRNQTTDLNFPGIQVKEDNLASVYRELDSIASDDLHWLILSGSLPGSLPITTYADFIKWARQKHCKVVLDSSGPAFASALQSSPDIIKPNLEELRELTGEPLSDVHSVAAAARRLVEDGVGLVVVSMGEQGAVVCNQKKALLAVPTSVDVISTVGAGDAMVAGLVHAAVNGINLEDTAKISTAFSLGALERVGPNLPDLETINTISHSLRIEHIRIT